MFAGEVFLYFASQITNELKVLRLKLDECALNWHEILGLARG